MANSTALDNEAGTDRSMSSGKLRVAVTGTGGPSATSLFQVLGNESIEFFAGDIDPYAAGLYMVAPGNRWILHRGGDPRYVDDLLARCVNARIDVLIPTTDYELLPIARRRGEFEACGIRVMLAPADAIVTCLDKARLVSFCADVCPVPRTVVLDAGTTLDDLPFPILVKPRMGSGGTGVQRISSAAQLAALPRNGTLIAQEYLSGKEYSVDVLCSPTSEVLAVVPRSRLKIDSGIAVTGMTLHDERLVQYATAVATLLGLTFVANIQFREDASGTPRLLDVNARFPGTMPLTVAAGVNMPRLALDLALGLGVPPGIADFKELAMTRVWREEFFDVSEVRTLEMSAARQHLP
ncbi:MAG: hypothetical protein JWM95_5291 [Gemmatimonadetes bacterium]|nr:hypothetical protein [Gemmatimonadota bacterium]